MFPPNVLGENHDAIRIDSKKRGRVNNVAASIALP